MRGPSGLTRRWTLDGDAAEKPGARLDVAVPVPHPVRVPGLGQVLSSLIISSQEGASPQAMTGAPPDLHRLGHDGSSVLILTVRQCLPHS